MRGILGVVSSSKSTNGICVTTSDLTKPAKEFVEGNARLDFVTGKELIRMLNEHLGPSWFYEIERLVAESKTEALSDNNGKAA